MLDEAYFYICSGLVSKLCPTLVTPSTVAHKAPLSMGFPRQEYWSGLPSPFPGNLPNPGIEPASPASASRFFTTFGHNLQKCGILVPQPGLEPALPTLEEWSCHLWATREVPNIQFPVPCELTGEGVLC